jgi:hypothetical protein
MYKETAVVEQRLNDVTYVVKVERTGKSKTAHVDKMKLIRVWPADGNTARLPVIEEGDDPLPSQPDPETLDD